MTEPQNSPGTPVRPVREGLLPAQPVRWGLPDAVVVFGIGALGIVITRFLGASSWVPHTDLVGVIIQTLLYAIVAAALIWVVRTRGLGRLRTDFGFELRWIDLLIGVGLAIAVQIADVVVYQFAVEVLRLPRLPTSNVELPRSRGLAVFDGLAIAAFLAPIVEELLFRGLIMRSIRNFVIRHSKFESPHTTRRAQRVSILLSALVFAAAHLYESRNLTMLFVLGVSIFIFGLITAAIVARTGRLGPSLITHILVNGFAAVTLLSGH